MKQKQWLTSAVLILGFASSLVYANTEWIDMVSPINHSFWKGIAVTDFNTDGIPDIVAANPDAGESWSDYSGLPVWIGQVYNGSVTQYYWGISSGSGMTGNSTSMPVPASGNRSSPHVACVYNGNSCNMMAEWTMFIYAKAGIRMITTTSGDSEFEAEVPDGVSWRDVFHIDEDVWFFEQIGASDAFSVQSNRYGSQVAVLTLGIPYTSDNGEITILVNRVDKRETLDEEAFLIITHPAWARVRANYRDHPDPAHPRYIVDFEDDPNIEPGKWFYDKISTMKVRFDPKANDAPLEPGDSWHFHTPDGPLTNNAYYAVQAVDVNRDGQVDILGAGPSGIDVFLQTGPIISEAGFIPKLPDFQGGSYNNDLEFHLGCLTESLDYYVNSSVIYDEFYNLVYKESLGGFQIYGEFTGASGEFWEVQGPEATYCGELTLNDISGGPWKSDDRFTFSTKRVNWGPATGPSTTNSYTDMEVGDVNNNGWVDIVASRSSGGFDFFSYDGAIWTQGAGISFAGVISSMFLEDLDRDGWLDLVASSNQGVHVWKAFPDGTWSQDFGPVNGRSFLGVAVGDFNKDGYFDLAATEDLGGLTGSIQIWYLNSDGNWFQRARSSTPTANPNNVGTGFMSVVKVSNTQTIAEVWTLVCESVQPDGGLFKVQGSRSGVQSMYAHVGETFISDGNEIEFTIFDGPIDYALNDTFTFYTGRGPLEMKKYSAIVTSDLNNDGNLDLFTTSLDNFGVAVWHGNGHYGWKADTPPESSTSWQALSAEKDLNFDGNPDIVVGSYSPTGGAGSGVKIWVGKHFNENTWSDWIYKSLVNGKFNKIANGDFNHDGELDLVLACSEQTAEGLWVFTGNGLGEFEKVTNEVTSKKGYFSVCTADFNLDGRSDIAAGRTGLGFDVFLTQEDLTWSLSTSTITNGEVYDILAADINQDGHQDIVLAQQYINDSQTGVMIYFNDGLGNFRTFDSLNFPSAIYHHWSVEVADLDVNGVLDIITTNSSGNPGTSIFYGWWNGSLLNYPLYIPYASPSGLDHNYGLISNDFNLDSRMDFVVGEDGHGGTGYIGYSGITVDCLFGLNGAGYGKLRDIASSDLNNDGYPDLVIASEQDGVQAFLTNPGYPGVPSFGFTSIKAPASDGDYVGITIADFTSDGLDDVIASRNQASGVSGLDMWISARDFSLPIISNTFPANEGSFNVGADSAIYVNFSKSMDPTTLTYENIQMTRDGSPISYSIVSENNNYRIRLTPSEIIRHSEYSVTIVGGFEGVRDAIGNMFDGNRDGQSQESPIDDYTFTFTAIDRVPPSIPAGLALTPGDAEMTMRWLPNSDPFLDVDLQGYYVIWEKADGSGTQNYKFYDKDILGTPPRITIRGLTNNVEYRFYLTSLDNDNNESAYSGKLKETPLPVRPQIWWGGLYNSFITSSGGGDLTILAYVIDMQGDNQSVELYYDNLPTGVFLTDGGHPDFPSGLGLYALFAPTGPLNSGYLQIPFQLVATDAVGNQSLMWPYYHVQNDLPGAESSEPTTRFSDMDGYFAARHNLFLEQTSIPFSRVTPSTSPNRPQILCAGYTAHPVADFEFGAEHWMTAIIVDPDNTDEESDIAYVDMTYFDGTQQFINEGTVNIGKVDQLDLNVVIWATNLTWYGEQTDPDGPDGSNHWPVGPQYFEIQAVDREGNASDIWPNFTIN
ncbi:VCBS repeat-containing protein [bacterium]|nr:VCBS repeat-containing protein [candidate division CSSED10-310 bacterium]